MASSLASPLPNCSLPDASHIAPSKRKRSSVSASLHPLLSPFTSAKRSLVSEFTQLPQPPAKRCSLASDILHQAPKSQRKHRSSRPAFGHSQIQSVGHGSAASGLGSWRSLGVDPSELCLALSLPTGQSFRWKLTGESEFTGVVDQYLVSLRQLKNDVQYLLHDSDSGSPDREKAEDSLRNYFNLDTSLKEVWAPFVAADARFAALAPHMAGARLLRQHPVECVFQFICSSNNHIQRIAQMVDYLASRGPYLGTVKGLSFHAFPSLERLASVTEAQLRDAGFGYRAKYIVGAVKELHAKKDGGEKWLFSLRSHSLEDVLEELCTVSGIGPKVAACIALFSLDQHHAIPVDTHVWQIATTYITPELSGERLTPRLHMAVSEAFVRRFGKYAGWAQNVLFIAELSSHQLLLPEHLRTQREKKLKGKGRKQSKEVKT